MKRPSASLREGREAGAWLLERVPLVLKSEFDRRPASKSRKTTGAQGFASAVDGLKAALGPMARNSDVERALGVLDGAVWDLVVEYEDRAFHAAWTLAMQLRGGAR